MKVEWLCWNCNSRNVGRLPYFTLLETHPLELKGKCVNCDKTNEITISVTTRKG